MDQVVNPKVASVFIPQVEDVVYNYLGIPRKKATAAETSNGKIEDLLPTDLEAVSPGSVNDDKLELMDTSDIKDDEKMDIDDPKAETKEDVIEIDDKEKIDESSIIEIVSPESESIDKSSIPLPAEEIKLENIPAPENSPPNSKNKKIDLEKIDLPKEPNLSTDIPLPDEMPKVEKDTYFKPIQSDDDDSSSDSSLRRNMSPLTPIRNFNNENSCDAQQAFENDSDSKSDDKKEPSTFRFTIESKSPEHSSDKIEMKPPSPEQQNLSYQFNQVNINTFNTPLYDDSSNSHNLQIDYESDVNSKMTVYTKLPETENSTDSRKDKKDDKRNHKSSHRSRDSHRHSSSKDKDSKHSSRDSSRHDKKKDDKSKSTKEKSSDRSEKDRKDSRDSSKHRSSHKSSSHKESNSKSHRSSSSSKHSSKTDDKKSSSSKEKDKSSDKSSKDKSSSKSSSHRSDKDRKNSKSKSDEKENKEKKEKKETDDHYGLSGRGNPNRRSTDRDSNDGSSSSKGSHNPTSSKTSENKKDNKGSSKSDNTSTSNSTSPSDKEVVTNEAKTVSQTKPIVRVDTKLEIPISSPPRLPFVPDVTLRKPRFAANLEEAKRMIKMRKFLEDEQKRMNQEAALLLEFQANVRPSLSQVYSSIPGPELEFACVSNVPTMAVAENVSEVSEIKPVEQNEVKIEGNVTNTEIEIEEPNDMIARTLIAMHQGEIVNEVNLQQENIETEFKKEHIEKKNEESLLETLVENNNEPSKDADKKIEIIEEITQDDIQDNKTESEDIPLENKQFEITIISEELSETEETKHNIEPSEMIMFKELNQECPDENLLKYFAEHEKYNAEVERDQFSKFLKIFTEKTLKEKLYLINCDTYEENLIREVSQTFGNYEIVNYYKNGHLKLPKPSQNIVKNVNVTTEITLPTKTVDYKNSNISPVFSPVKSECSFELSSDYDAKLEEMVNKTSRQEIMEIILGNVVDESPTKMPRIDYCMDSNIEEADTEMGEMENVLKRKLFEVESTVNNNINVLTPNKIRKLSGSDQISSTTEGKICYLLLLSSFVFSNPLNRF